MGCANSKKKKLRRELMLYAFVANFAKWGGGVLHKYFNPPKRASPRLVQPNATSTYFEQIRTNSYLISYESHTNFRIRTLAPNICRHEFRTKFVQNSYKFLQMRRKCNQTSRIAQGANLTIARAADALGPTPCVSDPLLYQHRGSEGSSACSSDNPALNTSSKLSPPPSHPHSPTPSSPCPCPPRNPSHPPPPPPSTM